MVETRKRKRGGRARVPIKIVVRNDQQLINAMLDRHSIEGEVREFLLEDSPVQSDSTYYVIDIEDEPEIEAGGLTQRDVIEGYEFDSDDSRVSKSNNRIDMIEMYPRDEDAGRPSKRQRANETRKNRKRKRRR